MLVRVAIFAALGGFLYGYDLGLIGGAMLSMRDDFSFSEEATEVIVAAAKVGGIFGTFLGGGLMLYYGRRTTIALDSVFFMMGPIIMASASGITGLVAGRLLIGLGIGISAVVVPAYLGELAPAKVRGRIVEIYEVVLCVGMLAAVLADAALVHAPNNWRWMVGLPVVPGMILSAAMWMLPESPRWLVVDGRLDEALAVIHVIYTNDQLPAGVQESTADVEHELLELWSSVEKEKEAVNERASAAQMARACKTRAADRKQVRLQGRGSRWHTLQEVHSEQHERHALAGTGSVGSSAGIPDRPPGPHRTDGKVPPSPAVEVAVEPVPEASSGPGLETASTHTASGDALPGLPPVHTSQAPARASSQGSSPEHGRALHRQLSDPTSPLYRSLSEIPQGLRPIRTTSFSTELGDSTPATPVARNDPHKTLRNAATVPRRRGSDKLVQERPGYWVTQRSVVVDMWRVLWGPESRAVRLALWIAIFDQAMASTAIVNYAPALIQQTALSSNSDATLWTGYVTGAKIVGSVAAMFLVDTAGRRPLLIWGSVLCGFALLVLGAADALHSPVLMVVAMCAFILAFSASYAGVFWVLLSEIFSMSAKAPAASAATAVLFVAGALPDLVYLTLHSWLGPAAFLCFAGVAFSGALYCHINLPETKGRTLAEVQVLLSNKGGPAASRTGRGSLSGSPSHASAHGLTHAHEELMRPNAGAAAAGRAMAGRNHSHALAGDDDLMEAGARTSQFGAHWLSRQWAGYVRFNPQEA